MEPNPFEWAIFVWVMGFVWNEFKQVVSVGVRLYLKVPSKSTSSGMSTVASCQSRLGNYVDCSMNLLYLLYFVFLFASMILTRTSLSTFGSATYWDRMANYDRLSESEQQYYLAKTRRTLYWLNADRFYWENGDLHNLAEAFFAMGNVMSICRICFLLPIIAFVGPLQVSVRDLHFTRQTIVVSVLGDARTHDHRYIEMDRHYRHLLRCIYLLALSDLFSLCDGSGESKCLRPAADFHSGRSCRSEQMSRFFPNVDQSNLSLHHRSDIGHEQYERQSKLLRTNVRLRRVEKDWFVPGASLLRKLDQDHRADDLFHPVRCDRLEWQTGERTFSACSWRESSNFILPSTRTVDMNC